MLDHVETVEAVVHVGKRRFDDIMILSAHASLFGMPSSDVVDKERVEIIGDVLADLLQPNAGAECVAATDLADGPLAAQHFRDELVAGEQKAEATRIVMPDLIGHEPQRRQSVGAATFKAAIVLSFPRARVDDSDSRSGARRLL